MPTGACGPQPLVHHQRVHTGATPISQADFLPRACRLANAKARDLFKASASPAAFLFKRGTDKHLKRGPTDVTSNREEERMDLNVEVVNPLVALIAGILILIMPRLLNYVVAIYLIVIGIIGLSHHYNFHV
jgi:Protein of unknown function (DUF3096)